LSVANDPGDLGPKWASGPVASDRYGTPERTLSEWAKNDRIVTVTIGRRRYYSIESLDALFAGARAAQPTYTPRAVPWDASPPAVPKARKSGAAKARAPVRRRHLLPPGDLLDTS
jgi:hypothetical protein